MLSLSIALAAASCGGRVVELPEASGGGPTTSAPSPSAPSLACTSPAAKPIVSERTRVGGPVVNDETWVYWVRRASGSTESKQIVRAPLGGGPVELLVSGVQPTAMAVDESHLYWAEGASAYSAVARIAKSGGEMESIVGRKGRISWREDPTDADADLWGGTALVVHGDDVFWAGRAEADLPTENGWSGVRGNHVMRAAKTGGSVALLADVEHDTSALASDDAFLYWVDAEPNGRDEAVLRRVARRGRVASPMGDVVATSSMLRPPSPSAPNCARCLASDGAFLYWLSSRDGSVVRFPKDGGRPLVLAADQSDFVDLAVHQGFVYWSWSRSGGGGVRRVAISGGDVSDVATDVQGARISAGAGGVIIMNELSAARLSCDE